MPCVDHADDDRRVPESVQVLLDLLVLKVIPVILFASISYYMVGLTDDPATFGLFLLGLVLFNLTGMFGASLVWASSIA